MNDTNSSAVRLTFIQIFVKNRQFKTNLFELLNNLYGSLVCD